MRMTPFLILAMAACSPQSTYTAAFLDFTPDAAADPIREVLGGNGDFGSGDVASVGDGAVEVEAEVALGEDELEADVYTGPAGCAPPYGPCPDSWECIVDAGHPLGGFCGCECSGSADPYHCAPDGSCFTEAAPIARPEDEIRSPDTVGGALGGVYVVFLSEPPTDTIDDAYLPLQSRYFHVHEGVVGSQAEAVAACEADTTGGPGWKWRLTTAPVLALLAHARCPGYYCDQDYNIRFPLKDGECPTYPSCWPFASHDGDARAFWTLGAYLLRFAPSGVASPADAGWYGGVVCTGVHDPNG